MLRIGQEGDIDEQQNERFNDEDFIIRLGQELDDVDM